MSFHIDTSGRIHHASTCTVITTPTKSAKILKCLTPKLLYCGGFSRLYSIFYHFYIFGYDLAFSVPEPLCDLAFGLSLNNLYKISHVSESSCIIFPVATTVCSFIWDMFSVFLYIYVLSLFGPLRTEPVVGHPKSYLIIILIFLY